jgi:hypothetical protein
MKPSHFPSEIPQPGSTGTGITVEIHGPAGAHAGIRQQTRGASAAFFYKFQPAASDPTFPAQMAPAGAESAKPHAQPGN